MNSPPLFPAPSGTAGKPALPREGECREALARFFLSLPPEKERSAAQRAAYPAALRLLHRLELRSVLQNATLPRPLLYGDLYGTLRELLLACRRKLDAAGVQLSLHLPNTADPPAAAGIEPRITAMTAVELIRRAAGTGTAHASLFAAPDQVILTVGGLPPDRGRPAAPLLAQTAARLHRGSFVRCGDTAALSFHVAATHTGRWYVPPTADALLRDPLSPVQVGLT